MKITAKDVATIASTSTSAVSRAFRPGSSIDEGLRARILRAADEIGYQTPSGAAVSQLSTGTISLVVGDLTNPFYPTVLEELSQALFGTGRRLILHVVPGGKDVDSVMQQVLDYKADAAIITSATLSSTLAKACQQKRFPVVLFNRTQPEIGVSAVCCDNFNGGWQIGSRLTAGGRRKIAFVSGTLDTSTNLERWRGFSSAVEEGGATVAARVDGHFEYGAAFEAAAKLFERPARPDAIFCANDIMALAAIDAAKKAGIRVSEDVAIIGFDDIPMAAWQSYRLTTVRQRIRLMIRETLDMIEQITRDPAMSGSVRITPCQLIERDSG
ncbi:substrate-binding domain-containing protein [Aurantimonas aggregata]|uniref:Substrate-binding domain-containing protein n=1 Tax=Aurantimonas aggregata TaxID=2047720 RepID=A0A6L9MNH6_9HYPH|nr:LacI family DNA-binding transcriptional regulator [Aurantimonas aggregata]NDV89373.1 substrate-binding domain-containing protein [Aurantimonas aggregata]